ncbi:hypothetical protein ACFU98_35415 [Streptomyces sp. NPDC057575]|uniref:hypothetical protein n=1 Tax=unclassified Streptomyces TaxID=2593676 RepID=UPI0036B1867C
MSSIQALADALARQAADIGASTPAVRGGDWRLATVATVGTDGTITTTDGIVARRLESYTNPAVGDLIRIDVSSSGGWTTPGRTAGAVTDPTWTSYTPVWTAATTAPSIGNGVRSGRYMLLGKTCHLAIRQASGTTTTVGAGAYSWSLPFAAAVHTVEYLGGARLSGNSSTWIGQCVVGSGGTTVSCTFPANATTSNAANLGAASPETFTTSSVIRFSLTYQIA